jgi:poly(A) polymerase
LVSEGAGELVELAEAIARSAGGDAAEAEWCRQMLARPREELDPRPLLTGDDLKRAGLRMGPAFRRILDRVRAAQLDGQVRTQQEAIELAKRVADEP